MVEASDASTVGSEDYVPVLGDIDKAESYWIPIEGSALDSTFLTQMHRIFVIN